MYGASNLNITGNVTWNGQIMETGTDGLPCANNRFTRNIGYKGAGFQGGCDERHDPALRVEHAGRAQHP